MQPVVSLPRRPARERRVYTLDTGQRIEIMERTGDGWAVVRTLRSGIRFETRLERLTDY